MTSGDYSRGTPDTAPGEAKPHLSRAERRRLEREAQKAPEQALPPSGLAGRLPPALREKAATGGFRLAVGFLLLGFVILGLSQTIPHDYGFLELGWLFPFSVYDLVLAMLGLGVAVGMAASTRRAALIVAVFVVVMLPMLMFFDLIFTAVRESPLGNYLFLIAPGAVVSTGLVLWLPGRVRDHAALFASAFVSFAMSLFIGLDDMGVGIADFASGTLFSSIWLVAAPGFVLRQFAGPWLKIPARIVGSWLVVIAIVVTVSLYVPTVPFAPPPPQLGSDVEQNTMDMAPDGSLPGDVIPQDILPQDVSPDDGMPDEAMPQDPPGDDGGDPSGTSQQGEAPPP
ncbi:hypothetical protein [Rhizobium halophytocola]|uniref:Cell division protein FtsK n=1 Tax=Rhizobium halophytocola TaxID=735519 RepID=A0ABS4DX37_9HYPH|nr:hypothetical protein [Rhizobium halophytocola]MBP1850266.1 hypothetical protein [Rhizobium halophytocola]